jgi:polysaccharide export outer membrane protein
MRPALLTSSIIALAFVGLFAVHGEAQSPSPAGSPDVPQAQAPQQPLDAGRAAEWQMWSGGRYRITPGDVLQISFPYVPEFDQTVTVQPDGYVALRSVKDVYARGRTVEEFKQEVLEVYSTILRQQEISVVLKEFEKPYFVASGEVARPGKYDLRGATTVTQALAVAGGWAPKTANKSQVIVFRRFSNEMLEVKEIKVDKMFSSRDLSEDLLLRPGDTIYVPQNRLSKIERFIPVPAIGLYLDPLALFGK